MKTSNSPLVSYTKLSPNHSGLRTHKIDTITIHCVVGHLSLQTLGNVFAPTLNKKSSNYGIDDKGKVGMYVEEKNRAWCSASNANDQRAVTIEVACDPTPPYRITDAAMKGLIDLCIDICKRNDIPELLWNADKSLIGKVDKQNMTVHRWFAKTECPGEYIFSHYGYIADEVNKVILKKPNAPVSHELPYSVKVKGTTVYFRKGPGTNHPVVGTVRKDEVYTIVEEAFGLGASKWGKLKSGSGWISLDLCTRTR